MESVLKGFGILFLGLIGFHIIMRILYSGPSTMSKEHNSNKISEKDFEKLHELFDDALNLLAAAQSIRTKKVALAVRHHNLLGSSR